MKRRWRNLGALFGLAVLSCAKQQPSEPAAVEAAPESVEHETAEPPGEAPPAEAPRQQNAPEAPARPGAAPRADEAEKAVLPERGKAAPTDIHEAMAELDRAFSGMNRSLLMLSAPDCVTGARLRDRVCDLAEHICRLAEESGQSASQELCGDGRARCAEAKKRYAETCPEP